MGPGEPWERRVVLEARPSGAPTPRREALGLAAAGLPAGSPPSSFFLPKPKVPPESFVFHSDI